MASIKVEGYASDYVESDTVKIYLETSFRADTSAEAVNLVNVSLENLLAELKKVGVDISKMSIERDDIDQIERENEYFYFGRRRISFITPFDMVLINGIRMLLQEMDEPFSFDVSYYRSNHAEILSELTKKAVEDSRKRAGIIADAMGLKIEGIETADVEIREQILRGLFGTREDYTTSSEGALSELLKAKKELVEQTVSVTWILG